MKLRKQLFSAIYLYVYLAARIQKFILWLVWLWGFLVHFLLVWVFVGLQVFVFLFNKGWLYEVKSLFAVIHVLAGCFWIYTWILVNVSSIYYNSR